MAREERSDAASRICRVLVFVTRPQDDTEHPDQALVIVEEGVPGVRVLFDILVDLMPLECTFQPRRRALQRPVATAKARDHRTGTVQDRIDVVRDLPVVRRYRRKAVAGRQKDRKTACRAEADNPDPARAILAALPSSNAAPLRAARSTIKARMQRMRPPQENRSGATAR